MMTIYKVREAQVPIELTSAITNSILLGTNTTNPSRSSCSGRTPLDWDSATPEDLIGPFSYLAGGTEDVLAAFGSTPDASSSPKLAVLTIGGLFSTTSGIKGFACSTAAADFFAFFFLRNCSSWITEIRQCYHEASLLIQYQLTAQQSLDSEISTAQN
jgi:hypothetical protein